jgi:uncharacterized protein
MISSTQNDPIMPILNEYGVGPQSWKSIIEILLAEPSIKDIILFGSRAKGTYRIGSDIDLAISGDISDQTYQSILVDIEALEQLYHVDIINLNSAAIPTELRAHINRVGIKLNNNLSI